MLAGSSLITALIESYPEASITFVASPQNAIALEANPYINELIIFDKKKLSDPEYLLRLFSKLRKGYDLCIAPATVSLSFTNDFISRLTRSKFRIGIEELDGTLNKFSFFFNNRVPVDFRKNNDTHIARRILKILEPLNISNDKLSPVIIPADNDVKYSDEFLIAAGFYPDKKIIGIHTGAGKPANRWDFNKFIDLIHRCRKELTVNIYLTAGTADMDIVENINSSFEEKLPVFLNQSLGSVAALIAKSSLFITNDTGIMHVAATTKTPQISLFGPTNPRVWQPMGTGKFSLRNSDDINSISVDEVFGLAEKLLGRK